MSFIDWNHPAVDRLVQYGTQRALDRLFPPEPRPDPMTAHMHRMLVILERQQAAPTEAQAQEKSSKPYPSRYLTQEGVGEEWDTGCLGCGVAHLGLASGMLKRASEIAQTKGPNDHEVQKSVQIARKELASLFAQDWTPERIARTPPNHRQILDAFLPKVRRLQEQLANPMVTNALLTWADLHEADRFVWEESEGVGHPEVELRLADAETAALEAERVDLGPERLADLPPEQQEAIIEERRRLRHLRQSLKPGVIQTPRQVSEAARQAYEITQGLEAHTAHLYPITSDRLQETTVEALDIRDAFRKSLAQITSPVDAMAKTASEEVPTT